jgi:L-histidine N-alpha-methyltransferase
VREEVASGPVDARVEFARAVHRGLTDGPRRLPCRYLYDERGSALFEQICETPEYYLTRTEAAILGRSARKIRAATGPVSIVELGAGSAVKTDRILAAYAEGGQSVRYVPVDVSPTALAGAATRIAQRFPSVELSPRVGTFEEALLIAAMGSPSMCVFLGSSIGNLDGAEAHAFWEMVAKSLAPGDFFLLGVDLVKDRAALEAAYNDAAGVTAAFTRNIFARMNRELDAGLDVGRIEHVARWSEAHRRIEIWGVFHATQRARLTPIGQSVEIRAGEQVLVEISRKFVLEDVSAHLGGYGLGTVEVYTDEQRAFGLLLLQRQRP